MGYSKDQLLARLQDLQIDYAKYEHPVVLTVEEQAKYVGSTEGVLSKNLFLKDKKQRFYIVSAMADTKVDMKVLSQRLGLGKGGVRMAPEELLGEILQVPLGCVTPFAVVNESARDVSLLLDQKFKSQARCIFHPLSNDVSISLNTTGLDNFLQSIGREPVYVDLEANPAVGKDHPPDLAAYVPSGSPALPEAPEKLTPSQAPAAVNAHVQNKPVSAPAKASKPSSNSQNAKDNKVAPAVQPPSAMKDPEKFIEEIFEKTSALLLSEIKEDSIKQHGEQLGSVLADSLKKRLKSDLTHLAIMYKNTAYAEGFYAGTHHQPKRL